MARHGVEWPPANSPLRLSDCNYLSLLGRIEVAQVRRFLVLAHRHQIAVGAQEVVLFPDQDVTVVFIAVVWKPTDIARDKDKLIGDAVWEEYLEETGRRRKRKRK